MPLHFDQLSLNAQWFVIHLQGQKVDAEYHHEIIDDIIENAREHDGFDLKVLVNGKEYDPGPVLDALDRAFDELANARAKELVISKRLEELLEKEDVLTRLGSMQEELEQVSNGINNVLNVVYGSEEEK